MQLDWLGKPQFSAPRVLLCGMVGGLLAFLHDVVDGGLDTPWLLALAQNLLMGAGAAFASIYVLLGTNTAELLRTCGIALLAGYAWDPVFEAGKEYVLAEPERQIESKATSETAALVERATKLEG